MAQVKPPERINNAQTDVSTSFKTIGQPVKVGIQEFADTTRNKFGFILAVQADQIYHEYLVELRMFSDKNRYPRSLRYIKFSPVYWKTAYRGFSEHPVVFDMPEPGEYHCVFTLFGYDNQRKNVTLLDARPLVVTIIEHSPPQNENKAGGYGSGGPLTGKMPQKFGRPASIRSGDSARAVEQANEMRRQQQSR